MSNLLPETSMPEIPREVGSQLLLLLLLQLQKPGKKLPLRQRPKRNRRPSRSRKLMPLLFYLRHNQNNMPRAKAKEKGLREVPVDQHLPVRRTRRRFLAIFTLPSNPARRDMIVKYCEYSHDQKVFDNNKKIERRQRERQEQIPTEKNTFQHSKEDRRAMLELGER